MTTKKKASDEEIKKAYEETRSVWKAALRLGLCGQSVHERLVKMKVTLPDKKWTSGEISILFEAYTNYKSGETLEFLSQKLGKHRTNICRKAREFGLTNMRREKSEEVKKALSESTKKRILENGHPKGFLGEKHNDLSKQIISKKAKKMWEGMSKEDLHEWKMKGMKTKATNGTLYPSRIKTTWKAEWREVGGVRKFFRSRWEANFARYLQWLKERGEIIGWEHEPETFWFDGVKRGCVSYLPDFRVTENGGKIVYYEVKGWMDDRSKTKLKRMKKYHPKAKLILIQKSEYAEIGKKLSRLISDWE